ncbi:MULTISPECIES: ABC transporter substrate-binding protein [Halorussus]|uniref:ABC transporter substrate-binding protein n=1 Tax=Halorussus TaxID=1070314 RepID=UPI000E20D6D7|nr:MULTISPECIES: ABC transporter substrate-binding protein [Halorussus]NHN61033.1 ABC transporter substrate-binding protein [Halorussus sp. JP-T4]
MASDDSLKRRSFLKAAGGAAAAATLAGCTGGDSEGQETTTSGDTTDDGGDTTTESSDDGQNTLLTYGRGSGSTTLDPQATTTGEDAKVLNQVYDRLVGFKPGGSSLVAALAKDWNQSGKTATLTLRQGATFHNGEEFTADDFIATYRRFLDSEYEYFVGDSNQSIYGPYLLGNVEDVEATGDYELKFTLSKKYAPFVANLAVFALAVMPRSAIEGDRDLSKNPVGTGPFSFEKWNNSNQTIRLMANGEYWGEGPHVDEVVFTAIGQNTTRAQSLDTGEVDIIDGIGAQAASVVKGSSSASLKKKPGMTIGYMAFNMARVEAFRNKKVRKAISHAINTKAIVENIYRGQAVNATQPLPPNVMGHNSEVSAYEYDPEKAQSLLEEAGYGDGFSFELATMTNPRPYFASPVQTAQTVKSNLGEVGIDVSINKQSWNPYLTYTAEGKHDACFLGWISDNADPDNFFSPLLGHSGMSLDKIPEGQDWVSSDVEGINTGNRARWANREFLELIREGQSTYEQSARKETYEQASKLTHDEAPWVFMTHTEVLRGVNNRVKNYTVAPISGPFLNLVSVE